MGKNKSWLKKNRGAFLTFSVFLLLFSVDLFAGPETTLSGVAAKLTSQMGDMAKLITACSYVAGMGFAIGAILKFKAHKDNPGQVPIGTPIALVFIAAALIFLPQIFAVSGGSLFGSGAQVGHVGGITNFTH